jgi:hypothetical protein
MIPGERRAPGATYRRGALWHHGRVRSWLRFALVALCLAGPALAGCAREEAAVEAWPDGLPRPKDAAEAERLEQTGTRWTNRQARQLYLERVAAIAGEVERWKAEQIPAEEQARRAYQLRHDARMTARAMMSDPAELAALQERDRAKYGHPDGPTFDWLMARNQAKGLEGDAAYLAIVESAQKTDAAVNQSLGF